MSRTFHLAYMHILKLQLLLFFNIINILNSNIYHRISLKHKSILHKFRSLGNLLQNVCHYRQNAATQGTSSKYVCTNFYSFGMGILVHRFVISNDVSFELWGMCFSLTVWMNMVLIILWCSNYISSLMINVVFALNIMFFLSTDVIVMMLYS